MRVHVAVATGAVIGATTRWAVGELVPSPSDRFPWATLIVNLVGCAAVGALAARWRPNSTRWAFAVTGVLGGLTTTSAFAVETRNLLAAGDALLAAVYVAASVGGGAAAVIGARRIGAPGRADGVTA